MQQNFCIRPRRQGSITLFLALILTLVFSLFFSLLEAARVQALSQIAKRSLWLEMESAFGEYQIGLWEDYQLLFLDGSNESHQFDLALLEGRWMEQAALEQKGAGFFQIALKSLEITEYSLATDNMGAAFEKQACLAIQEQLAAGAVDALKQRFQKGEQMAEESKELEQQWDSAKNAMEEAENLDKEAGDEETENSFTSTEEGTSNVPQKEEIELPDKPDKDLPQNPVDSVDLLKKSAILAVVVENPSEVSGKSISLQETLKHRHRAEGNMKSPDRKGLEKLWFLQYLNHFFACKTGEGKGGSSEHALEYELEYCVAGKDSDQENLEKAVKELLLIREAGNFATIMQDKVKYTLALEIATAAVGFTGIAPLIQAVQIGILLAWSYIESILDLRCLPSGGKIPLVKQTSEWKSDISLGEEVLVEKKEKTDSQDKGLSYREYLQLLLLLVGEEVLTYRAMDVIEQNIRLQQPRFRFDHQLYGMQMEGLYASKSLFLGLITVVNTKDGAYHFRESRSYSYLK